MGWICLFPITMSPLRGWVVFGYLFSINMSPLRGWGWVGFVCFQLLCRYYVAGWFLAILFSINMSPLRGWVGIWLLDSINMSPLCGWVVFGCWILLICRHYVAGWFLAILFSINMSPLRGWEHL
jgi:hypothetical protein